MARQSGQAAEKLATVHPISPATAAEQAEQAMYQTLVERLSSAYKSLVKFGEDSVRMAWDFGDMLAEYHPVFRTKTALARAVGVSVSTITRYMNFRDAYQRPGLAIKAYRILETSDIRLLTNLVNDQVPGAGRQTTKGKRYHHVCTHCGSDEVVREEMNAEEAREYDERRKQREAQAAMNLCQIKTDGPRSSAPRAWTRIRSTYT